MNRVAAFSQIAATAAMLALPLAHAGAGPSKGADHPERKLDALVRKMLIAQNRLQLSGIMATQSPQGNFTEQAYLDGAKRQRYVCIDPVANRGETIIDNGRVRVHEFPNGRNVFLPSQIAQRRVSAPLVMREIKSGNLHLQYLGQGMVAGIQCDIIKATPASAADWYEYWIDPANGAQLQIEQFSPSGGLLSSSTYQSVQFHPKLEAALFQMPTGKNGPLAAILRAPGITLSAIPTVAQAGFVPLQPSFLPPGFRFQSAAVIQRGPRKLVKLTYGNGLNALSLFETPMLKPGGANAAEIKNPRPGVVITRRFGLILVLVGSQETTALSQIIDSVH